MTQDNNDQHWKPTTDVDGILWLHFDKANSSTNVLSASALDELDNILTQYTTSHLPSGIVFISDKTNGFIAGADIEEFTQLIDQDQALTHIRRGQTIFDRIEALSCPTVALIHGFCLGGGLELALACRYRIADDGVKTKIGLPEVQLGIHPGFGGSVRLPKLIGAPAAMDMMLTGRALDAKRAKRMGVIDYAVPTRQLLTAAKKMIMDNEPAHRPSPLQKLTNSAIIRPILAHFMRKKVSAKALKAHYPAPYALIDLWEKHAGHPKIMMQEEARSVAKLVMDSTAKNLIRVFFLREKLKSLAKPNANDTFEKAQHVHVIGVGIMGADIAAWCALRGLHVTLQDRHEQSIANALQRAHKLFKKKLRDPRLITATMDRLLPDMEGRGVAKADVVIEAIIENVEAKRELYQQLEPQMKPGALLTTNTSSIPLETLSETLTKPGRLVGLHFFNPVAQMPLIEIVTSEQTDEKEAARAAAFAGQIDRLPLPVKSSPGFLVNRILMPYMLEAVRLKEEGVKAELIDQAALNFGMPMGPLHLADTVGLDICVSVADILSEKLDISVPPTLHDMVKQGYLGVKTGKGFYQYKNGKPLQEKLNAQEKIPDELIDRMIGRMVNEAVACLREGVVSDKERLDAGIIFGTGFAPFRGGPLNYASTQGIKDYVDKLNKLEQQHGNLFKADDGWSKLVAI